MSDRASYFLSRLQLGLIGSLLVATPLAFGAVEDRWIFLMEGAICGMALLWVLHEIARGEVDLLKTGIGWPVLVLLAYLLLTLIPLPAPVSAMLSPEGALVQKSVAEVRVSHGMRAASWIPVTLAPFETTGELLKLLAYSGYFFLLLHVLRLHRGYRHLGILLIVFGTAMAVFGVTQDIWGNRRIYGKYESASGSPFGPFVNHNHFAGYLEMTLGLCLGMLVAEIRRVRDTSLLPGWRGYLSWIWDSRGAHCWLLIVCALMMLIGIAASLSRGGVLSIAATSMLFAVYALLRKKPDAREGEGRRGTGRYLVPLALMSIVVILALLALSPRGMTRWGRFFDDAASYRIDVWRDSLGAVADFTAAGAGLGSFRSLYPRYKSGHFNSETSHAENEFIQWTVETGIIGLLLLAAVGAAFARKMALRYRSRKDPYFKSLAGGALFGIVSLSIHNLMDFNLHVPSNALTFVTVAALGLIAVNVHSGKKGESFLMTVSRHPARSFRGAVILTAVAAAAIAVGFGSWARYQSLRLEQRWSGNRLYLPEGDPDEDRFELLRQSLAWCGWNDRAHALQAQAYEAASSGSGLLQLFNSRRFLERSRQSTLEALQLRPIQAAYWSALGRVQTAMLDGEGAERAFREALRWAGSSGAMHRDYALSLLFRGRLQEGAARLVIARNYNIQLRDCLEALASYTEDPALWQSLVRYNPEDLRAYAGFLSSRGQHLRGEEILRQAEALEKTAQPLAPPGR